MRIVYFGTPDFAVAPLRALSEAGHELVLVVTQPDKPRGRGHAMQFPPVKEEAYSSRHFRCTAGTRAGCGFYRFAPREKRQTSLS